MIGWQRHAARARSRTGLTALLTAAIACAVPLPAAAAVPSEPTAHSAATTLKPGTPRKPAGVRITTQFGWNGLDPSEQPSVTGIELWFPRGSVYNGAKYPRCSADTLDRHGLAACPKGSIMGHGTGTAFADTVITRPQITVVNGGPNAIYFYTVLNNPARVQTAVVGNLQRLRGNFAYHLTATIPQSLLVVAGVPIKLTSLTITAGRASWIALAAAPAGLKVLTHFDTGATQSYMLWAANT